MKIKINQKSGIVFSIMALIAIILILGLLFISSLSTSFCGVIVSQENAKKIISKTRYSKLQNYYDIKYGMFSSDETKYGNYLYYMKGTDKNEVLFLVYYKHLDFYSPTNLLIDSQKLPNTFVFSTNNHYRNGYSIRYTYPNLTYNINKIPLGTHMKLYGVVPDRITDTIICESNIKIIETDIDTFSINVIGEPGIRKNIPVTFNFIGTRNGAIIFLEKNGKKSMFIYYYDGLYDKSHFRKALNRLIERLCLLS